MDLVFMEYDESYVAGHKASSISSIESGDHPPSLYSGHADSCSSLCDPDEPLVFEDPQPADTTSFFRHHGGSISIPLTTNDDDNDYDPLSFICHDPITQTNPSFSFAIPVTTDHQKAPTIPHDDDGSSTLESKTPSTLLSQDEKRVNHIASEQKRRQNIRTGFQQLTELIPALKNVPHRKSTILFKTADYIKHTEKRNKILQERLRQLQRRLSLSSSSSSSPSTVETKARPVQSSPSSLQLVHIRRLQKQLLRQQELLQQHNIPHRPYIPFNHIGHHRETKAIIMPVSDDDDDDISDNNNASTHQVTSTYTPRHPLTMVMNATPPSTPCLNIPADEEFGQEYMVRERLLSCGKLKLKHVSS